MSNFSEEELAMLSDEEREALEDAPEDELEPGTDDVDGDQDTKGVATEDAEDAEDAEDSVPEPFVPKYKAEGITDFDERMRLVNEAKRQLGQQYQDGELDWAEFEDKRDALDEQALNLREAKSQNDLIVKLSAQNEQQHWQWEQDRFFAQKQNALYKNDELAYVALDHMVKKLANAPENAGRPMTWFLEEADRQVRNRFANDGGDNQPSKKAKPSVRLPPNLGDLPPADLQDTGNPDEFALLDKLSGMELERAISKLSLEQQERYLMG